jgi:hypothetical protein
VDSSAEDRALGVQVKVALMRQVLDKEIGVCEVAVGYPEHSTWGAGNTSLRPVTFDGGFCAVSTFSSNLKERKDEVSKRGRE